MTCCDPNRRWPLGRTPQQAMPASRLTARLSAEFSFVPYAPFLMFSPVQIGQDHFPRLSNALRCGIIMAMTPRRIFAATCLLVFALALGGCSHCGWIWDDWRKPQSCRGDWEPAKN